MNTNVAKFLEEFDSAEFNHALELIAGLRAGEILFNAASEESNLPASHYIDIFQFRLRRLDEQYESKHTEHTKSLRCDIANLCERLRIQPTEKCDLWIFTKQPYYNYAVFIGNESRMIIGCVRAVDNRLVTQKIRIELWGDSTQ